MQWQGSFGLATVGATLGHRRGHPVRPVGIHTLTHRMQIMCSALLRARHSPPATHTTIILILFMDPSALIHKRALFLFFLRAPPKLSSAPKNYSARVIVAEAAAVCVGCCRGVGGRREEDFALGRIASAADCRDADPALITDYRLSHQQANSALPGYKSDSTAKC